MKAVCPHCLAEFPNVPDEYAGMTLECPRCKKNFVVKKTASPADLARAAERREMLKAALGKTVKIILLLAILAAAAGAGWYFWKRYENKKREQQRLEEEKKTEETVNKREDLIKQLHEAIAEAEKYQLGSGLEDNELNEIRKKMQEKLGSSAKDDTAFSTTDAFMADMGALSKGIDLLVIRKGLLMRMLQIFKESDEKFVNGAESAFFVKVLENTDRSKAVEERRKNAEKLLEKLNGVFAEAGKPALSEAMQFDFKHLAIYRKADAWDMINFLKFGKKLSDSEFTPGDAIGAFEAAIEKNDLTVEEKEKIVADYLGRNWRKDLVSLQNIRRLQLLSILNSGLMDIDRLLEAIRQKAFEDNRSQFKITDYADFKRLVILAEINEKDKAAYEQFLKSTRLSGWSDRDIRSHFSRREWTFDELLELRRSTEKLAASLRVFRPVNEKLLSGVYLFPEEQKGAEDKKAGEDEETADGRGNTTDREVREKALVRYSGLMYEEDSPVAFSGKAVQEYGSGGKKADIAYKHGQRSGKASFFHEDGGIQLTGEFQNDVMEGEWKFIHRNGTEGAKVNFHAGRPHGLAEFYDKDGNVTSKFSFEDGVLSGDVIAFFPNGKIRMFARFNRGNLDGKCWLGDEAGNQIVTAHFTDDVLNGEFCEYHPDGKNVRRMGNIINGNGELSLFDTKGERVGSESVKRSRINGKSLFAKVSPADLEKSSLKIIADNDSSASQKKKVRETAKLPMKKAPLTVHESSHSLKSILAKKEESGRSETIDGKAFRVPENAQIVPKLVKPPFIVNMRIKPFRSSVRVMLCGGEVIFNWGTRSLNCELYSLHVRYTVPKVNPMTQGTNWQDISIAVRDKSMDVSVNGKLVESFPGSFYLEKSFTGIYSLRGGFVVDKFEVISGHLPELEVPADGDVPASTR